MNKWVQWTKEWGTRSLGDMLAEQLKRFLVWWKTPAPPKPWSDELDEAANEPDSKCLCSHCFTPQEHGAWFCPECGAAVGPYNNTMPYLNLFSTGEMLRAGVGSKLKRTPLINIGYVFIAFAEYLFFAPVFLYRFVRNRMRPEDEEEPSDDPPVPN